MAKRNSRRIKSPTKRAQPPLRWTFEQQASLIAYNDFCIEESINFEATVVPHLRKRWLSEEFNGARVDRKMRYLWQQHGMQNARIREFNRFKEEGTKVLDREHFEPSERDEVNRARSALGLSTIWQGESNLAVEHGEREKAGDTGSPRSLSEQECGGVSVASCPKRPRLRATSISDSQDERSGEENENPQLTSDPCQVQQQHSTASSLSENSLSKSEALVLKTMIFDCQTKLEANELQINRLFSQLSSAFRSIELCEHELLQYQQSLESAKRETNPVLEVQRLAKANLQLKQQRQTSMMIEKIADSLDNAPGHLSMKYIQEELGNLQDLCWQTFDDSPEINGRGALSIPDRDVWDPDGEEFIRKILSVSPEAISLREFLAELTTTLDLNHIVQAIMSGFLQKHVFEEGFPKVEPETSSVLASYRKSISVQEGGLSVLRSLDMVAYHAHTIERFFKECTVPKFSAELTVVLLRYLAPFLRRTISQDLVAWCRAWFEASLNLKTQLCLNQNNTFEMVMYAPKTRFNATLMKSENPSPPDSRIQLCLFPSFFSYSKDDGHSQVLENSEEFRYNNVVKTEESFRVHHAPIFKARVLVGI
ncbi:hypothetical protein EJ08DRAFT_664039 [Tothia fuscella]|uniref:Uncharacterized protein n=1 Tax=Tothia fuscella TaxID=1048955 RepID=A0A9P4NJV3_9PEZI|nr:hypothetical protein EJ08DRAFT_664039 [Tothia fuscella]